eukprot:gene8758-706_t
MTTLETKQEEISIIEEKKEIEEKLNIDLSQTFSSWTESESELFYFSSTLSLPNESTVSNSFEPVKDLKNYSVNLTKDHFVIFGGENEEGLTNLTLSWDNETKEFKELKIEGETKPSSRSFHNSLILNNQLYIFGGKNKEKVLNDMYSLDLKTNEWKEIKFSEDSEIPKERQGSVITFHKDKILLHGGCNFDLETFYSDFYEFDTQTNKWSKLDTKITNEFGFHTIIRCIERLEILNGMKNKTEEYKQLLHFPEFNKLEKCFESKEEFSSKKIINLKSISETFENVDGISSITSMSDYKYKLIRKQLEEEFHLFYDKPTEETLFKTILLKYLHMVMINFPLFQTQTEKKEKGFMEKLGWGAKKEEEYGFGDLFFKLPDLITKLETSFKKDYQKDLIDYGAALFNYVLKTNKETSIADEFSKKFSKEGTKESLGNQKLEEEDVNLISDILHLDHPAEVYNRILEATKLEELPLNYQKMIQHASQRLMKWLKMTDVSDDNMEKLKWTKNFLIIVRPVVSSVNPLTMIEKMMNLMLFSKIGRSGITVMLEVSKTESEVKKRKQMIPSLQVENVEKYLSARDMHSSMRLTKTFLFSEEEMEKRKEEGKIFEEKELPKPIKKQSMFKKFTTKKELPTPNTKKELPTTLVKKELPKPTSKKELPKPSSKKELPTPKKELPTPKNDLSTQKDNEMKIPNINHIEVSPRNDSPNLKKSTTPRDDKKPETKSKALSFEEQEKLLVERLDLDTWKQFVHNSINNQNSVFNKSLSDQDLKNTFLLFRAICRLHEKKEFIAILDDPQLQKLVKQVMKVTLPHIFQLYAHTDVSRVTSTITTAMSTFISLSDGDKKANTKIAELTDETKKQQLEKKRMEAWDKTFGGMMESMKGEVFQILHEMITKDKEKDNIIGKLIAWVNQMAGDVGNKSLDMEEIYFKFDGEERDIEFLKEINYLLYNTRNLPQTQSKQKPVKSFSSADFIKKEEVKKPTTLELNQKPQVRSYSSDPTTHHVSLVDVDDNEDDVKRRRKKSNENPQ